VLLIGTHQSVYRDWPVGKLEEDTLVESPSVLHIILVPHQQGFHRNRQARLSIAIDNLPTPRTPKERIIRRVPTCSHSTAVATPFRNVESVNQVEPNTFVEAPSLKVSPKEPEGLFFPSPLSLHDYFEALVLASLILGVLSAGALVVALVFRKCNLLMRRRYSLSILLVSAVTLVFARALDLAYDCIAFSIDETLLASGITPLSLLTGVNIIPLSLLKFSADFGSLVIAIYLVAMILFGVSSFQM